MIIMKFGGSSLANAERFQHVGSLIRSYASEQPIIVLSAVGDTTDHLLECGERALRGEISVEPLIDSQLALANELGAPTENLLPLAEELRNLLQGVALLREMTPRAKDRLVSFGERFCVRIAAPYFESLGLKAKAFDAWDVGLVSSGPAGNGEVVTSCYSAVRDSLHDAVSRENVLPVVTGFIAKDSEGNITTLGRGGSDLTACALGAGLGVKEVQVWKDVDGILTANPNYVRHAEPVPSISFEEASELAYFGATVLHPRALLPAMQANIPVRVKNSYNPEHPGTLISRQEPLTELARAVTCKRNLTLIDIVSLRMLGQFGFLERVFEIFARHQLSVDMVATSEVSISLTLDSPETPKALQTDLEQFARVKISKGKASVNLIGNVERSTEVLGGAFEAFKELGINVQMVSHGASKVQFGFIVDDRDAVRAVAGLHDRFFSRA